MIARITRPEWMLEYEGYHFGELMVGGLFRIEIGPVGAGDNLPATLREIGDWFLARGNEQPVQAEQAGDGVKANERATYGSITSGY